MSSDETLEYATPVINTLNNHVTIRNFNGRPISDEMMRAVLNASRRSPTSSNTQTYSLVVVRNPETKKRLAVLAGNQKHVETCDVFIAICADIHRLEVACQIHGKTLAKTLELTLVASIDAALVGMSIQTAAESFGLGGVMIGGMRNHPKEAAELLGFPSGVYIVYGMCLGWPDETQIPLQKPRLQEELVIHHEQYNASDPTEKLTEYDRALSEHYNQQGRNLDDAAWTGVIADRFSQPRREYLKGVLEELGFVLD